MRHNGSRPAARGRLAATALLALLILTAQSLAHPGQPRREGLILLGLPRTVWAEGATARPIQTAGAPQPVAPAPQPDAPDPVVVPAGQRTDAVVTWGRPVDIAGTVTDEVLVVWGDVTVRSTAVVQDRVIAIGGRVTTETGAEVRGGTFAVNFSSDTLNGLFLGLLGFGALEVAELLAIAGLVVWSVLVSLAFGRQLSEWLERHPLLVWRGFLAGAVAAVGLVGTAVLIGLTVWGLPLSLLLVVIGGLGVAFGFAVLSLHAGASLVRIWPGEDEPPVWLRTALGAAALGLLASFPLLGVLIALVGAVTALGTAALFVLAPRSP